MRLFILGMFFSAVGAYASLEGTSRVGADFKMFRPSGSSVMVFGSRFLYNPSDAFSIGGAAYTGELTGTTTGSFSYGGLASALSFGISRNTRIEFGLTAGGGGGFRSDGSQVGGIVIEPSLAVVFGLGKNVGGSLHVGYLWIPSSQTWSGISAGFRFEFFNEKPLPPTAPVATSRPVQSSPAFNASNP